MNKLLLFLFLLPTIAFGQTTYVPDDNFENYLESKGLGDGIANNNFVLTANISSVDTLFAYQQNISDLTGIEDFTALTDLYCWNNNLTSLDVSNNTALTYLACSGNQLTSLDLSNNTALTTLSCSSNQLSLDLSNNTALWRLICNSNHLTSLDVSNNTALEYLECSSNQLTSLDVSNNTALEWLDCLNNQLISLDVSNNEDLTELRCNGNQLTSLNVSNNTALEWLDCSVNQLTCLNVKNGNNSNITPSPSFYARVNPSLYCIEVDDAAWSTTNWTLIDAQSFFSEDCNYPTPCGTVTASWDCINNTCTDPGTGNGAYSTLAECQASCDSTATSIIEISQNKELLLITDLLGRTTYPVPNRVLFYIYDDGTVGKKIRLEK